MTRRTKRRPFVVALAAALATASGCAHGLGVGWPLGAGAEKRDDPSWNELMRVAERARRSGDLERALVGYLRALQHDPERPLARIRLAQLQLARDPLAAAEGFRRVLVERPEEARAWSGLAVAALALGRLDEARAAFAEARRHAPGSVLAQAGEAAALDLLGQPDEASGPLAEARERHPEALWLLNNVGVSRLLAKDWSAAEAALRELLEREPDDVAARNNLGLALGGQGRYGEAYHVFREAGDEQAARNNLGYVYFLNGRYDEAVRQYELALAADGDDTRVVLANLNAALDAMGGRSKVEKR